MSHWTEDLTNVSQSVRDRLMNTARDTDENFQAILVRYATERLMYRITCSDYGDRFVLKGAWLFYLWDIPRRTTRDVDFLGHGESSADQVEELFLRSTDAEGAPREFSAALGEVGEFAYPVLKAAAGGQLLTGRWTPEDGWS